MRPVLSTGLAVAVEIFAMDSVSILRLVVLTVVLTDIRQLDLIGTSLLHKNFITFEWRRICQSGQTHQSMELILQVQSRLANRQSIAGTKKTESKLVALLYWQSQEKKVDMSTLFLTEDPLIREGEVSQNEMRTIINKRRHAQAEIFKRKVASKDAFANEMWTAINDIAPNQYELRKIEQINNFSTIDGVSHHFDVTELDIVSVNYFDYEFVSKDQAVDLIKIKIVWHNSYDDSNSGWRMEIFGINDVRQYRRPRVVHEKIFNYIQEKKQRVARLQAAITLQDEVIQSLCKKYPEAPVTKYIRRESYNTRYYRGRPTTRGFRDISEVAVTHPNGLVVYYSFSRNADNTANIAIRAYNWTSTPNAEKLIERLRTL